MLSENLKNKTPRNYYFYFFYLKWLFCNCTWSPLCRMVRILVRGGLALGISWDLSKGLLLLVQALKEQVVDCRVVIV